MKRLVAIFGCLALGVLGWLGRGPIREELVAQGLTAKEEEHPATARRLFGLAVQLGHVEAPLELALLLQAEGDFGAARHLLDEMRSTSGPQSEHWPRLLAAEARQVVLQQDFATAAERYDRAVEAARNAGDRGFEGRLLLFSGELHTRDLGDLDGGRDRMEKALEIARSSGLEELEAEALTRLGIFFWWFQRERERPLPEFYRPALEIYERLGDLRGVAFVRARIGLVHLANNDFESCVRELEASREGYEELGDSRGVGEVLSYLGALYASLENLPLAHDHYRRSLEIAEENGDEAARQRLQPLLVDLELRRGEFEQVVERYDRMIEEASGPSVGLRNHLVRRGEALIHLERYEASRGSFEQALDVHDVVAPADGRYRSRILTGLAHAHRLVGDLDAADEALEVAESIPIDPTVPVARGWGEAVYTLLARADLAGDRGQPRQTLGHLVEAAEIESRTYGTTTSHFFQTQYRQVLDRLFSLLLAHEEVRDGAEDLVFRLLEQMRYRAFRSVLVRLGDVREETAEGALVEVLEEIRRASQAVGEGRSDAFDDLRRAYAHYEDHVLRTALVESSYRRVAALRPVDRALFQDRLMPDVALVEYVLTEKQVFALVVSKEHVEGVVLPISTQDLEPKVKLFQDRLFEDSQPSWQPLARELDRLLIEPLESSGAIAGARRLVLVPMGVLHELPFAALQNEASEFLVERYRLSRTPSATLWGAESSPSSFERPAVTFGLRKAARSTLEPLDFAEREARKVGTRLAGRAHLGDEATEAAFKTEAPEAGVVHVAAHGIFESRLPLHSRLALEAGLGEDGDLTVREILDLDLRADLVTLSACETGRSRSGGLEVDRLGFVEAFLHVGAQHVLASLLPISDGPSAEFMVEFYDHLETHEPPDALALTQRNMARSETIPPRVWAGFVLVGRR